MTILNIYDWFLAVFAHQRKQKEIGKKVDKTRKFVVDFDLICELLMKKLLISWHVESKTHNLDILYPDWRTGNFTNPDFSTLT